MKVTEYLKRFLNEQPTMEAAVPGLGVFYAGQKDGKSCILFKEVVPNDKAFLNSIAFEENMTEEEVRQEMETWVRELLQELKDKGMVNMEGVGSFVIEQDRVNYNPFVAQASENDANFGLEGPAAPAAPEAPAPVAEPAAPARPEPAEAQPERRVLPPINRPQQQRQPRPNNIGKPQLRTAPNAGGSAKGIRLENAGNRPARPQGRPVRPERNAEEPFYTRWWFIALCAVVVLLVLMFSVTPIRRDVLGIGAETKAVQMGNLSEEEFEEALAEMIFGEEEAPAVSEKPAASEAKKAEETKAVEQQIIAGEKEKKDAEKAAKASPQPLASTKPAAKPAEKPAKPAEKPAVKQEAKPAAKPAQKTQGDVAVVKPQPGRFYIIVGGFRDESNAFGHAKKMRESGLSSTVLYNEEKSIYYVSVKTCVTREEAMAVRTDVRDNKKMDCWIYTK